MTTKTVTLQVPEILYQRLVNTARATGRPLEEVMLQALKIGSPPDYDDAPEEFQADLAALDKLDDDSLWQIVSGQTTEADRDRYDIAFDRNKNSGLTEAERSEFVSLRHDADLFTLRKAQAAVLLRWRGHRVSMP